ncbi:MAG: DUF2935 domain-containing protein [Clostridia bacterium]|nr:DUF2935 domain-containing protein [Clostridia bacterium]
MNTNHYISKSLELHLFFARIMKEHALFLKAGFTPANADFSEQAEHYQNEFEKLLCRALSLSEGVVGSDVLTSGEIVTDFTCTAEAQTEAFTCIAINKELTEQALRLRERCRQGNINPNLRFAVHQLNQQTIQLLNGLIAFKEKILSCVLGCKAFTMNYPLLIEHIIREAKLYREHVLTLERQGCLTDRSMREVECFWNRIMMEHALFIRGLLDPSENELIDTADRFACEYAKLLEACDQAHGQMIRSSSLEETVRFRDFKTAGVEGIEGCKIRSVILPLLADHVLREANHYLRLLNA